MNSFKKGDIIVAKSLSRNNTGSIIKARENKKYVFIRMSDVDYVLAFPINTTLSDYSFRIEIDGKLLWIDYRTFERIPYSLTTATGYSIEYDVITELLEERDRMQKKTGLKPQKKKGRTYIKIVSGGDCSPK